MTAIKEDIAELMNRLESKVTVLKTDVIKWMFIFWTSYVLITLGGLYIFLKFFLEK